MTSRVHSLVFFIVLIVSACPFKPCFAQDNFPFPHIENYTTENGLSNNSVYSILEDNKGFLWFATSYGLNRFDGYTFKTYTYDIHDKNSITAGWVWGMMQDKNGTIWIPSSNEGFYSFDNSNEKFIHYRH